MKAKRIELREIHLPLVHFFETSFGRTTERRMVLVRVEADGLAGWGEVTAGETPFYSYETPETAWHILRDFLIPWTMGREWARACEVAPRFRPIRGHNMAKAALENACWDIEAQRQGLPLAQLVGGPRIQSEVAGHRDTRAQLQLVGEEHSQHLRLSGGMV